MSGYEGQLPQLVPHGLVLLGRARGEAVTSPCRPRSTLRGDETVSSWLDSESGATSGLRRAGSGVVSIDQFLRRALRIYVMNPGDEGRLPDEVARLQQAEVEWDRGGRA